MFTVRRPPRIESRVASWRASWGTHVSPARTATSSLQFLTCGAMAAAKATVSIPSAYPEGRSTLSKPSSSTRRTRRPQWSQLLSRSSRTTPSCS